MSGGNLSLKTLGGFVTASIVSGCIIPPLFQSFWQVSADKGFGLLAAFHNSLYMNAAIGNRNWMGYLTLTILIAIFTVLPIAILTLYIFSNSGGKKKRVTTTEVSTRKLNVGLVLAPILVINVLAGIVTLNYAYSDLQLNGTFEQYLSAIGPVLNDVEEKKLRSDWALMESEADCVKIFRAIADKSGAAGISLPKKSMFFSFLRD